MDQPQASSDLGHGEPAATRDGIGQTREATALQNFEKNRALDTRAAEIQANARARLKEALRATATVPAPVVAQTTTTVAAPVAQTLTPDPTALASAFTAQLDAKHAAAQQALAQAQQIEASSLARAKAAEAKLQEFMDNPVAYMENQKLDADSWNARLLNGGQLTPEEKYRADLRKELQATVAPLSAELQTLRAAEFARAETAALTEARTILAEHFPLVNHFVTPEGYIAELKRQVAANGGKPVDAQKVAESMESAWLAKTQGALQNPKAAAKVAPGTTKSPPSSVAAQAPSTMTNRTTSTVPGQQTRAKSEAERIARGRDVIKQLAAQKRI